MNGIIFHVHIDHFLIPNIRPILYIVFTYIISLGTYFSLIKYEKFIFIKLFILKENMLHRITSLIL